MITDLNGMQILVCRIYTYQFYSGTSMREELPSAINDKKNYKSGLGIV